MLILTRKIDEKIMIGDDIEIMIVGQEGDQVKIGIEAPRDIPIHRHEVYEEIKKETINAVESSEKEIISAAQFIRDKSKNKKI